MYRRYHILLTVKQQSNIVTSNIQGENQLNNEERKYPLYISLSLPLNDM